MHAACLEGTSVVVHGGRMNRVRNGVWYEGYDQWAGRYYSATKAPCSLCGTSLSDGEWCVVRASLLDADGVYFSYLCHHESAECCLGAVLSQQNEVDPTLKEHLTMLLDLYQDDEDAVWCDITTLYGALTA